MTDARLEAGMQIRREVLGDAYVDRAQANTSAMTEPFQEYITRSAWGEVWTRPTLDRRTRSCLTLALLATLGHERELAMHVRAAVRNGLNATEIAEVLLHTAVYAGVPAANAALAVAQQTLAELGVPEALADGDRRERASGSEPAGRDPRENASGSEPAGGDRRERASGSEPAGGDRRERASGSEPAGGDLDD